MQWQERFRRARAEWMLLTFYERFEQVVILILTGLIAIVVVFANNSRSSARRRTARGRCAGFDT